MAVDVRQPVVASLMAIGQSFVIDAEEVKTGGVEVVDVNWILDNSEAKFEPTSQLQTSA